MNRLHKKCFIASAGVHLLLALILLVGPAFLSSKTKVEDVPLIDVIPDKLIDAAAMGGGSPSAKPPPPAPPTPPAPQPDPPVRTAQRLPDPPKDPPAPKPEADSLEPSTKSRKPVISTRQVVRKSDSKFAAKTAAVDPREQQLADARRNAADLVGKARRSLRDLSSSTDVVMPGTGFGEAYASYASAVKSVYEHAWIPPDDTADDNAITKVTVTIEYTGKVLSSSIIRASGESIVDRSVQRTLDRVTFIAPFPDGAKEKQRTYTINFNLKAKRGLG
jgi:TonB family protein